jgi:hypothetical protein
VIRRGSSPTLELTIAPVEGAAGYQFEIVAPLSRKSVTYGSIQPALTVDNIGRARRGKWRVATIRDGLRSRSSPWQRFVVGG